MTDIKTTIVEIVPYLAPVLTAIAAFKWDWIMKKLNIKREKEDLKNSSLNNLEKNIKIYQDLVTDLDERYKTRIKDYEDNFQETIGRLRDEIETLNKEVRSLKTINSELKTFLNKQAKTIVHYEKKYGKID